MESLLAEATMTTVTIPKLTLTMEGGTLVQWLKGEGQHVERDEPLFELETDKALTEVSAPVSGVLSKIVVREGSVGCGAAVGLIAEDAAEQADANTSPQQESGGAETPLGAAEPRSTGSRSDRLIRVTPAARRRAGELGVDIHVIRGSGPGGRVTQEDVEQAARKVSTSVPASFRGAIAERVTHAWRTVPHIHIGGELSAAGLRPALDCARLKSRPGITITDLLLFAVASILKKFPALNSVWVGERAEIQERVHLSFAVETDAGVITPVIHDADRRTLPELANERQRLMARARERRVDLQELEGGTFTVTNLGMYPVDFFVPIINYPQSAILAAGRLRDHVEIRDKTPHIAPRMWVNLAVDHRVADGTLAAKLLKDLELLFAEPANFA